MNNNNNRLLALSGRPILAPDASIYAVAESNVTLQTIRQMSDLPFEPDILKNMFRVGISHVLRLQSYAWPHLIKGIGHGAVIIGAPSSGRTLCYVPPLCQALCAGMAASSRLRAKGLRTGQSGAITLVLAADLQRVERIASLVSGLLFKKHHRECFTIVLTVPSSREPEFFLRLLNGVGCLVATPAQFLWIKQQTRSCIDFTNMRFIVFDDMDLMHPEQLKQTQQLILEVIGKAKEQAPQLVITSQSYAQPFLKESLSLTPHPVMLFGDILEAAIHGGTRISIHLMQRNAKIKAVLSALQSRDPSKFRTVIYCSKDKDIAELVWGLEESGYHCLPYYRNSDLGVRENVQRWLIDSQGEIVLCTDCCPELKISLAKTLIHYSMSDTWTKFTLRHLALADNLSSNAQSSPQPQPKRLQSLVLLDETNNKQLPRLVDFLQRHGHPLSDDVVSLAWRIRDEMEQSNLDEPALCPLLLSAGSCGDSLCNERHRLIEYDRSPAAMDELPIAGNVKLQIVKVYSPLHYCVRLLELLPPGAGAWQKLQPNPSAAQLSMGLQLHFSHPEHRVRLWPPEATHICAHYCASSEVYERVRILRVPQIECVNIAHRDLKVEVQALDMDRRKFVTTSGYLYVCPEHLRTAPPLAMDVRIMGLAPETGERMWAKEDADTIGDWLKEVKQPYFLQASVVFSLSHTLFVRDIIAIVYAHSLCVHVQRLSIRQSLLDSRMGKKCAESEAKVRAFFAAFIGQPYGLTEQGTNQKLELESELKIAAVAESSEPPQLQLQKPAAAEPPHQLAVAETPPQLPEDSDMSPTEKHICEYLKKCKIMESVPEEAIAAGQTKKKRRAAVVTATAVSFPMLTAAAPLPPGIAHPPVAYYQTLNTLELQVELPHDNIRYDAMLQDISVIIFGTLEHKPVLRFAVQTQHVYIGIHHHMMGRTVYISAFKKWVIPYPLKSLQFYKFMKRDLDKIEHVGRDKIHAFKRAVDLDRHFQRLIDTCLIKGREYADSDDGEDVEEECLDVERVTNVVNDE